MHYVPGPGTLNPVPDLDQERAAIESLSKLYAAAKECERLHGVANLPLPVALLRLLGETGSGNGSGDRRANGVQPPTPPEAPPGAKPDWIYIDVREGTVATVLLGVLRSAISPLRYRDLQEQIARHLPNANPGSVANAGARFADAGIIERDGGWALLKPEKAPAIYQGFLWGPASLFNKQELAAHRRAAILHLLGQSDSGLQAMQLIGAMRKCSWIQAPINKDLVKGDLEVMLRDRLIRRRGNTRKWEVAPREPKE